MFEVISYSVVLKIHVVTMMINIALVVAADVQGLLWVVGKREVLNAAIMKVLHKLVWIGLGVSIITGLIMFSESQDYLLTVPAFYTKMLLVGALIINSFFINKHLNTALSQPFSTISGKEKLTLFVSGGISTVSWVGVIIAAQFLGL